MLPIRLIQNFKKFSSLPIKFRNSVLCNFSLNSVRKKFTSFDLRSQIENDVVIFELEKPKFFIGINFFSGVQCVIYSYLGFFLRTEINKAEKSKGEMSQWLKVLVEEKRYVKLLSGIAMAFGFLVFIGTLGYTCRSIRKIILHKGGKHITMMTYGVPGFNNKIQLPLSSVSACHQRKEAKKFMSLKVKDKIFHYLLDKSGNFTNPVLFDFTVGIQRNFA